jgi:hypothetical protein
MNVEHRLPCFAIAVEDRAITALGVAILLRERRRTPHHRSDQRIIDDAKVVQCLDVLSWNDQDVQWRLRVDVLEGDQLLVLVDDRPRDLARDDFAEETVSHEANTRNSKCKMQNANDRSDEKRERGLNFQF